MAKRVREETCIGLYWEWVQLIKSEEKKREKGAMWFLDRHTDPWIHTGTVVVQRADEGKPKKCATGNH